MGLDDLLEVFFRRKYGHHGGGGHHGVGHDRRYSDDCHRYPETDTRGSLARYCPRCGQPGAWEDKFCTSCGAAVEGERRCAQCGAKVTSAAKCCPQCGVKLKEG